MKQLNLFIGLFLFFTVKISAQKVSNVSNHQEQSTIIVSYDLETKSSCKIELYVSTNGGTTWQGPLKKVTGDVGVNVSSGSKAIIWNVLEEFDELRGNDIRFQVRTPDNEFETVKIGEQEWTIKNLNVSKYRNGDIIPEVKDPKKWAKLTTGAWCYYNNDPKSRKKFGKLYNWYAVNDPRGLAPKGYHIPTDAEWTLLEDYLGGSFEAGGKMKAIGTSLWVSPNTAATNESGFTGLPAGCRRFNGIFGYVGGFASWWSTTEDIDVLNFAYGKCLSYTSKQLNIPRGDKAEGYSVRCIKD
jgi:uncharacterized protein (TIGR02145 family)